MSYLIGGMWTLRYKGFLKVVQWLMLLLKDIENEREMLTQTRQYATSGRRSQLLSSVSVGNTSRITNIKKYKLNKAT